MCLITDKKPIVTKQDVFVYKILWKTDDNEYFAPFFPFKYELGVEYTTNIKKKKHTRNLRAFDELAVNYQEFLSSLNINSNNYVYEEGFHAFISKMRFIEPTPFDVVIVKCKIPKGSTIVLDHTGLIVSNKIVILEELPNN